MSRIVLSHLSNKRIGIEVTSLHPDDVGEKGGSALRKKHSKLGANVPDLIKHDFWPALKIRIKEKIDAAKNYNSQKYDSLWLLVTSNILQDGVAVPTMVSPSSINDNTANSLDIEYGESLKNSSYEMVHWCLYGESTYFSWSRTTGKWNKSPPPAPVKHYLDNIPADELMRWREDFKKSQK